MVADVIRDERSEQEVSAAGDERFGKRAIGLRKQVRSVVSQLIDFSVTSCCLRQPRISFEATQGEIDRFSFFYHEKFEMTRTFLTGEITNQG
ncbi:hypothetical protein PM8797T_00764 [Gimesia maris DSM 8797]|nr:hypothetical protein PM8797T_00764 [Gimesia maris DSM 8797]